jgi:hypothetical protein
MFVCLDVLMPIIFRFLGVFTIIAWLINNGAFSFARAIVSRIVHAAEEMQKREKRICTHA